jgi:hypothetical protein
MTNVKEMQCIAIQEVSCHRSPATGTGCLRLGGPLAALGVIGVQGGLDRVPGC